MKLDPGERSILSSFSSGPDAEAARDALRQAGFAHVQLDRVGERGFDPEAVRRKPGLGGLTQTNPVLYGHEGVIGDNDARILLAATPAVSGMAGEMSVEPSFLITVVTTEGRSAEALQILRRHGGQD